MIRGVTEHFAGADELHDVASMTRVEIPPRVRVGDLAAALEAGCAVYVASGPASHPWPVARITSQAEPMPCGGSRIVFVLEQIDRQA